MVLLEKLKQQKQKIKENPFSMKIIKNSGWLIGDKIFTMLIGVVVTAVIARYFGPEQFGTYNYAFSLVTLFTAFSTLGMETLTVKNILEQEHEEGVILHTSIILRIVGGIILTIASLVVVSIINPGDSLLFALVLILSVSMILKAAEVIEYWIQAYQRAKLS